MTDGRLSAGSAEYVGSFGTATFYQDGGTNGVGSGGVYLGYKPGSAGGYSLSGSGILSANTEYLGYGGSGLFSQSGGTNNVGNNGSIFVGYSTGASGSYILNTGGLVSGQSQYLGYAGTGTFTQSAGTNNLGTAGTLYAGYNSGASGSYSMNGEGFITAYSQYIGYSGSGSFLQTAGTNNVGGTINLGYNFHSTGTYYLSGSSKLIVAGSEIIGRAGTGSFAQSGGTNGVNSLILGQNSTGIGTYSLGGSGTIATMNVQLGDAGTGIFVQSGGMLSASSEAMGTSGTGTYTQSGGTNNIGNGSLHVGTFGRYFLSDSGVLSASTEQLGLANREAGTIIQTGGTNYVNFLRIDGLGRYQFSAGNLLVGGLANQGVFDATGSTGTLTTNGNRVVDLSNAVLVNTGSMSLNVGANSLVLLASGVNPATAFGSYTNMGTVHVAGTPLSISSGQSFSGNFTLSDFLNCQGTVSAELGGSMTPFIYLKSGVAIFAGGTVDLAKGSLSVDDNLSHINGGALSANNEYIGSNNSGSFAQSAGTNTVTGLFVGNRAASTSGSTYNLGGSGVLIASYASVGDSVAATISQTGGFSSMSTIVIGSGGSYRFAGGTLQLGCLSNQGVFDASQCVGMLTTTGSHVVDLSQAVFANSGSMSMTIGATSLVLVPANFNPATFSNFNNLGAIHYSGTPLQILPGQAFSGAFQLNDRLVCGGAISAIQNGSDVVTFGSSFLNAGVSLSGTGNVDLGNGAFIADNDVSSITGSATLWASNGYVGLAGNGMFSQSSGTNSVATIYFGFQAGSSGTYNLGGKGVLDTVTEYLGYAGNGTIFQTGGTNSCNKLVFGSFSGSGGTYNLNGGLLATSSIAASAGTAVLNVQGGTLQSAGGLTKTGSGALTITGTCSIAGSTTVAQGKLLVDGILASPVLANSGSTLGGNGHLTSVTIKAGGHLAPGNPLGSLQLSGSLTLSAGAAMDYGLDMPADSSLVSMPAGVLSLSGQQFSDFNFSTLSGFGAGAYTLVDAGSINGSLGANHGGTINGLPASIAIQGNDLVLNVVPEPGTLGITVLIAIGLVARAVVSRRSRHLGGAR
jgi:hypothetical protein